MIVFDLKCGEAHVFEAWFGSSDDYEDQRARGLVACPICGDTEVGKSVMAPNLTAKGNQGSARPSPEAVKAALATLAAAQAEALKESTWVGRRFAVEARAIHDGEKPAAVIHGQATPAEARALAEDGVAVAPLLVPIAPPDALN